MNKKSFEIVEVLNHNTLLTKDSKAKESYVFFGKGIGFKRKKGESFIYDRNVQNAMLVLENREALLYKELISNMENKKLGYLVQEIVEDANRVFDNKITGNLNLTLLDHLNFAIERQRQKYKMDCPFLNELQFIYPKEYQFSKEALKFLNENLRGYAVFDKSEIGFLTLHIHAAISQKKLSTVMRNNEIVYDCLRKIQELYHHDIDNSSIYYARFIKHLEFALQRYEQGIQIHNVMLDMIQDTCRSEYMISKEINEMLLKKYKINLDDDELGYLALHIYNLQNKRGIRRVEDEKN